MELYIWTFRVVRLVAAIHGYHWLYKVYITNPCK